MKCLFCPAVAGDSDAACEAGWIPSFYAGVGEFGPVCVSCQARLITRGNDGEPELVDYTALPEDAVPINAVARKKTPREFTHEELIGLMERIQKAHDDATNPHDRMQWRDGNAIFSFASEVVEILQEAKLG